MNTCYLTVNHLKTHRKSPATDHGHHSILDPSFAGALEADEPPLAILSPSTL